MSELSELEGTELYLSLCRRRIEQWEKAQRGTRAEHEAAEAFTRAFAELDLALRDGERLPREWVNARIVREGTAVLQGQGYLTVRFDTTVLHKNPEEGPEA